MTYIYKEMVVLGPRSFENVKFNWKVSRGSRATITVEKRTKKRDAPAKL